MNRNRTVLGLVILLKYGLIKPLPVHSTCNTKQGTSFALTSMEITNPTLRQETVTITDQRFIKRKL